MQFRNCTTCRFEMDKNKGIRCLSTVACKGIRELKKGKAGRPNFKFKGVKIPFYSPPQHETVINNPNLSHPNTDIKLDICIRMCQQYR